MAGLAVRPQIREKLTEVLEYAPNLNFAERLRVTIQYESNVSQGLRHDQDMQRLHTQMTTGQSGTSNASAQPVTAPNVKYDKSVKTGKGAPPSIYGRQKRQRGQGRGDNPGRPGNNGPVSGQEKSLPCSTCTGRFNSPRKCRLSRAWQRGNECYFPDLGPDKQPPYNKNFAIPKVKPTGPVASAIELNQSDSDEFVPIEEILEEEQEEQEEQDDEDADANEAVEKLYKRL